MNHAIAPCALRTHRRTWGLTQRELADLLGFDSPTHVSRLEHGKRVPGLETALVCATLFGVSIRDLFPQVASEAKERLQKVVPHLSKDSHQPTTAALLRKRELWKRALNESNDEPNAADA